MNIVGTLVGRNIKVFLRDKAAVFFSFLAVLIIIMLYALFLGRTTTDSIQATLGDIEGVRWMVDSWIMAGILVVNSITITLGVFGIMVNDEAEKRLQGFLVAPVKRTQLVMGYLFTAWIISMLLTLVAFVLAEIYIISGGGQLPDAAGLLKIIGLIALNVFSGSSMVFLLVSFVHSSSAFAAVSTVLGTMIGFLTGIYLPIGVLPAAVQGFMKFIPATHGTALMRQALMQAPMDKVFANLPDAAREGFAKEMGVALYTGETVMPPWVMLLALTGAGLVFFGLSVLAMRRKRR